MTIAPAQRRSIAFIAMAVLICTGLTLQAQRGRTQGQRGGGNERFQTAGRIEGNLPYDGRFTFVRLSYQSFMSRRGAPWSHDYPRGERHFMRILNQVSLVAPHMDASNVLGFDDPELMKYPIAYMAEPGYWAMTDAEFEGLKAFVGKGGFLIFDDFRGDDWYNLELQMNRLYPNSKWVDLPMDHPVFHAFFDIDSLDVIPQYYDSGTPRIRGLFEDNDPSKRLIAIANYNTDMSEFWEFSDTGLRAMDENNEAFKLGVNYIIYALTH